MLTGTLMKRLNRVLTRHDTSRDRPAASAVTDLQERFFQENGYLILPRFFSEEAVGELRLHLDRLWDTRAAQGDVAIDVYFELPEAARIFFRKAPAEARASPYKILDLHLVDETIRNVCASAPLMAALGALLGAKPLVCNSLLFEWGSQQYPHFDTFFMPSRTKNMMAASWVALDHVTPQNGPLFYYPKSHLIEPYRFSHGQINAVFSELKTGAAAHIDRIIEEHRLEKVIFTPEPGDVLIWHAQLLHGGSPILDASLTRRSLVTHYWTELDYPGPDERIDLGEGRWLLRKEHQYVIDDEVLAQVDTFLAGLAVPEAWHAAVPPSFDARRYLARNQDVLRAGQNPWRHYIDHGLAEGRIW